MTMDSNFVEGYFSSTSSLTGEFDGITDARLRLTGVLGWLLFCTKMFSGSRELDLVLRRVLIAAGGDLVSEPARVNLLRILNDITVICYLFYQEKNIRDTVPNSSNINLLKLYYSYMLFAISIKKKILEIQYLAPRVLTLVGVPMLVEVVDLLVLLLKVSTSISSLMSEDIEIFLVRRPFNVSVVRESIVPLRCLVDLVG